MSQIRLKRLFDFIVTAPVLIMVSPLMIVIAMLVWLNMGKPVLFRQVRPGLHGKSFLLYKFRTMINLQDEDGNWLPDAERLTRLGKLLRASSLDELPELFNILKGDMSIVGPRPLLIQYLDRYTPNQARRHLVKPGLTGWAQVNGRNTLSWEEKFKLDVWYVDHQSFWLDIKIILISILKVLKREGIHQEGQATASEFNPFIKEKSLD